MCGIIGYTGANEAKGIIIEGLKAMRHRGYDSVGLAIADQTGSITVVRAEGDIEAFAAKYSNLGLQGHTGIGHTRWATHGEAIERNAHPHTDCRRRIFVVHNGNIENFRELKTRLIEAGHHFSSDTDTEVVAHLVESIGGSLLEAVQRALPLIEGTYAFAFMSRDEPGTIVATRKENPLMIGLKPGERLIASDAAALIQETRLVQFLEDGDIAVITEGNHRIMNHNGHPANRPTLTVEWGHEEATKDGFPHFMLKEIMEQPQALKAALRGRLKPETGEVRLEELAPIRDRLRKLTSLTMVGCGSAHNANMVGRNIIQALAGIPVDVALASEYANETDVPLRPHHGVFATSQSGETLDTKLAMKVAGERGYLTLAILNRRHSEIGRISNAQIYLNVGPEIAVASTKAFLAQMALMVLLGVYLGHGRYLSRNKAQSILAELATLPTYVAEILQKRDAIKAIAERYASSQNFLYLGRGVHYPIALEGALKMKELSYIHAEGYAGGEMKHGPLALIDQNFPTLAIALSGSQQKKMVGSIGEIIARKGKVIVMTDSPDPKHPLRRAASDVIEIPKTAELLSPILATIPIQLLAYYIGVTRGNSVDQPRNIAKSVTCE